MFVLNRFPIFALAAAALLAPAPGEDPAAPPASEFRDKLQPLLEKHCFKCHNADKQKGGIDLTEFESDEAVLKKHKLWAVLLDPRDQSRARIAGALTPAAAASTLVLMIAAPNPPRFIVDADGQRESVVLDVATYEQLCEAAEQLEDIALYEASIEEVRAQVAAGDVVTWEEYVARSAK